MGDVNKALATFETNIERQTGKSMAAWAALLREADLAKHGEMVSFLKERHAVSHAHANHIAKRALRPDPAEFGGDPIGHLFDGPKAALRPLYDKVIHAAKSLGPDVSIAPKKANVSLRRRKQFALLQPSTRTRLDIGLILKGHPPAGRLEPSGSFHAMFTHRVKVERPDEIDAQLMVWLKEAYDEAE